MNRDDQCAESGPPQDPQSPPPPLPVIPYAGPVPLKERLKPAAAGAIGVAGTVALATGAVMFLVAATSTRTRGSSRSARLIWEARQQAIADELARARPPCNGDAATSGANGTAGDGHD